MNATEILESLKIEIFGKEPSLEIFLIKRIISNIETARDSIIKQNKKIEGGIDNPYSVKVILEQSRSLFQGAADYSIWCNIGEISIQNKFNFDELKKYMLGNLIEQRFVHESSSPTSNLMNSYVSESMREAYRFLINFN